MRSRESSPAQRGSPAFVGIGCLAAAILALFALLCFDAARDKSPVFDEPGFMLAGYSYLARDCPEVPTDNLRLAEMWIGLPLLAFKPQIPEALRNEKTLVTDQGPSELGPLFLFDPANRTEAMLLASRMAVAASAIALGWILFAVSRRLHGPNAGILTLALYCLNPVVISNSALATTDIATTLLFTVCAAAYWRLLHRPSIAWAAGFGISFGALLATKFSGLLFPGIAAVLIAVRCAAGPRPVRIWRLVLCHAAAAAVAYCVIWIVYGLHYSHGAPLDPSVWAQPTSGLSAKMIDLCRRGHLLPEAYLYDAHSFLWKLRRLYFLMGRYSIDGFWSFFPAVFFFKSPPALLLALCIALAAIVLGLRRNAAASRIDLYGMAPYLATGAVYGAVAVESRFNLGIRHILPVYPMLFIAAGAAVRFPFRRQWLAAAIGTLLLAGSAVEVLIARPNYLAYVNEFGGGSKNGWRLFVDSSYDWGQDLPAVKRWIDARAERSGGDRPVYFSYFGNDFIDHYGIQAVLLPQDYERRKSIPEVLKPGTYIICATMLQGIGANPIRGPWLTKYEEGYQAIGRELPSIQKGTDFWNQAFHIYDYLRFSRLCAYLRRREPDSWIAPNVLVYELDQKSLSEALDGPPQEMVDPASIPGVVPQ
jgi:hypothetical protein